MSETAPALLVSDADRERVAERLRQAAGEGRMSAEELEERLGTALSARTDADLAPLVADLPPEPKAKPRPRRRHKGDLRAFAATSVLLVAIWALSGAGYFWPVWPILGWAVFVLGPGRTSPFRGTLGACRPNASSRPSTTR